MTGNYTYPLAGFHFRVNFMGSPMGIDTMFQEVSGLSAELTVEELVEGGENRYVHKLPSKVQFPNLVLKRAMYPVPSALIAWAEMAIYHFRFTPLPVLVSLLNEQHLPVKNWCFFDAYPVKLHVSDLKAQDNALMIETLELVYKYSRPIGL